MMRRRHNRNMMIAIIFLSITVGLLAYWFANTIGEVFNAI